MEYADLLMDNGEIIRMEFNLENADDIYDEIENHLKCQDWLPVRNYDGCSAKYRGIYIDRVNMARVVAML